MKDTARSPWADPAQSGSRELIRSCPGVVGLIAVFALPPGNGLSEDAAALLAGSIDPVAEAEPKTARSDSLLDRWRIYDEPGRGGFVTFIRNAENGSG